MKQKIITGDWDGKEIWRWETPEETLIREGINVEVADLYLTKDKVKLI